MSNPEKKYLADGVYFEDFGFQIRLSTVREGGVEHDIYLDGDVLDVLFRRLEQSRNIKIRIEAENE